MKLTEMYSKSMKEIIEECDIINQKIHTDDDGNIQAIEVKYRPSNIGNTHGGVKVPDFVNKRGYNCV